MKVREIILEEIIQPSTQPGTMSLWHGGNLDAVVKYSTGRSEYGPGLYLITNYESVKKYAKGSRKLYMITIAQGRSANEVTIPLPDVLNFVKLYVVAAKRKDVTARMTNLAKDGNNILAEHFINVIVNEEAIRPGNKAVEREFLVQHGCDYLVVNNPFGWGNATMIVLFNMNKIVNTQVVKPKDTIAHYDLPAGFVQG
jgi:hypothetical protein